MDDGQHSFLFRHDLHNKCAPHIYSGVGYRVVYCYLGLSTTFIQIDEIGSTLSFLVGGQIRLSKILTARQPTVELKHFLININSILL